MTKATPENSFEDNPNYAAMIAATGWRWALDDMFVAEKMASTSGDALLKACEAFLVFVKQNPKLYECITHFTLNATFDEAENTTASHPVLDHLTSLVLTAYAQHNVQCNMATGFSRMIWATLLGLGNDIIKHTNSDEAYPSAKLLIETHITPKCRLIL